LQVGEDAVVTVKLNETGESTWPSVQLAPSEAIETPIGPVRIQSKHEVCWNISACTRGYHHLTFQVGEQTADKELAIGDDYMRVSTLRPGWKWSDALLHPAEKPFAPGSPIQSIAIQYPLRSSWISGSDSILGLRPGWLIYWLVVSMVGAFCFRRLLNVNI
jgi:hypothetical protein